MKTITMVIVWTMALVGMTSSPAQAKDTDIGHHNSGAVSSFCADTQGGTFLEGSGIYGCKWVRDTAPMPSFATRKAASIRLPTGARRVLVGLAWPTWQAAG